MSHKISQPYLITTLLLMLILPVVSILVEFIMSNVSNILALIGTWFLFWSVGMRLFTAGLYQVAKPTFTLQSIFHINNIESSVIVRELGFANICSGLLCISSLFIPSWRLPAAFVGGLFFGIAGIQHVVKGPVSSNEKIPMATNIVVFLIMVLFILSYIF